MKKEKEGKKILGWLLILAMLAGITGLTGCGQEAGGSREAASEEAGGENGGNGEPEASAGQAGTAEEAAKAEKVMGRYLETVNDSMKEEFGAGGRVMTLEDGSLMLMSRTSGKWVSADNGATWEKEQIAWFEKLRANGAWIMDIAVAKDGSVAVVYAGGSEDGQGEEEKEAADITEESGEEDTEEEVVHLQPKYGIASPDGTYTELEVSYKDGEYINILTFAEDGRLFGSAMGGKVYEIDKESGAAGELTELPGSPYYIAEKGNRLLLIHGQGVAIVDLEDGELIEDKVLDEFLLEQFGGRIEYNTEGVRPLLIMPGEDGVLYFAFEKGIYRHVIGGNVMEQVVDGSLTSLNNPSYGMTDGILLDDDEFLLLFSVGEMIRYTYNPNVPAVPEVQVRAYSLRESQQLKTVISKYQSEHPDFYIQYVTGIEKNSAVTREDALKKLNTEIAAGKGPDIFILDDMPIDSYKEKGVLLDLTPYLADKTEDRYFTNILKALQEPEGIYAVPSQFQIALAVGEQEDIEKMTDLEAIAETMETYREEKPEGPLLGKRDEDEMLNLLLPVSAPAWIDENGKINKESLTEFYTLAKKIWDVEEAGLDEDTKEQYRQWLTDMKISGYGDDEKRQMQLSVSGKAINCIRGGAVFSLGLLQYSSGFDTIVSCFRTEEWENGGFAAYNGQVGGVFVPKNLIGINKTSGQQEVAIELMERMLDGDAWENQPVNKEECREKLRANDKGDGSSYASMGGSDADGNHSYSLELYPASEEEVERLMKLAEESTIPYIRDSVLENAVCEIGSKVLRGEISASAGAEEVIQKTSIYMSE